MSSGESPHRLGAIDGDRPARSGIMRGNRAPKAGELGNGNEGREELWPRDELRCTDSAIQDSVLPNRIGVQHDKRQGRN